MHKDSKILIVGHDDITENSLYAYLSANGFEHVFSSSRIGLDPTIQVSIYEFFQKHKPEYVFLASTRSGGIEANRNSGAEFMYHNLESQNNVLYSAWKFGAKKLLYFGGSCVYPKECSQPMAPDAILTGPLEETSEPYSLAKIAGLKLCRAFKKQYGFNAVTMVPATVYGAGSDVDIETAHVMGALIGKFAQAVREHQKEVTVWGTGQARREFLHADDFVSACHFLMDHYDGDQVINAGCGSDVTIKELAETIARISGFDGKIVFDGTKPDGTRQKLLDSSVIAGLGWKPKISLEEGIKRTYQWYLSRGQVRTAAVKS
jgi:GDP-L-fucose synthase